MTPVLLVLLVRLALSDEFQDLGMVYFLRHSGGVSANCFGVGAGG